MPLVGYIKQFICNDAWSYESKIFYIAPLHGVQTCSGDHATSSLVSNKRSFPEGKVAGA